MNREDKRIVDSLIASALPEYHLHACDRTAAEEEAYRAIVMSDEELIADQWQRISRLKQRTKDLERIAEHNCGARLHAEARRRATQRVCIALGVIDVLLCGWIVWRWMA